MNKLLAATLLLAACGSSPAPQPTTPTPPPADMAPPPAAPPVAVAPAPPPAPHAQIGAWGFDKDGMDATATPGQDFYQFANGGWLAHTKLPEDKARYAMFDMLTDLSNERTKAIILAAHGEAGSEERKIADFYASFMDEAAIEAAGIKPIQAELDRINAIKNVKELVAVLADDTKHGRDGLLRFGVEQDDKDPEHYIATIAQGGLGLPDRDMFDAKNKQFEKARDAYKKYIAEMFDAIHVADADKRAAAVYALEEKLSKPQWTRTQLRDPQKTYNKLPIAKIKALAPGLPWSDWLAGVGFGNETALNVHTPSAIAGEAKLLTSEPIAVWKDYLTVHLLSDTASLLPKNFVDLHFDMYGKTLSGTPQLKDRWKRGVEGVTHAMGEAVGKIYVSKYFTPETKRRADELVHNLLTAMGQRLDGLAWMSPETKAKAKAKLATYNPKIGYPTKWRDYSALEVVAGDAVGNYDRAAAFEYNRNLAKLGKPVDRDEWGMTPMTVNAYYNPPMNEIVFPAAILQPPFFDANADDAVNYGGIGAVIGHEISHGFDDEGSQYDAHGKLANWWTPADRKKFDEATAVLVKQYDGYCPFPADGGKPAQCIKGKLTLGENIADVAGITIAYTAYKLSLGENIADVAGITIAYTAYKLSLGGKDAPVLDGMTGDQRFFLGFAQVWRTMMRDAEAQSRLVTDPHSPGRYRSMTVRNIDAWYDAFKAQPGQGLYLAPEQRVRIW